MIGDLTGNDRRRRRDALELIYKEYFPSVTRFVLSQGGTEVDALDVFQDGVIDFYNNVKFGSFQNAASTKTYLLAICKNKWYQKFRMDKKQIDISKLELPLPDEHVEINSNLLGNVMNELSPDCQRILRLFYYQKESMEQIKKHFNLGSIQAAKNKKFRCLKYLMEIIKEKGLTIHNFMVS